MARDYSSRTGTNRNRNRNKPRPRPAAKVKRSGPPGWLWLACGLCIGLVIAAGVFVFARPAGSPGVSIKIAGVPGVTQDEPAAAPDEEKDVLQAKPEKKPRFSFYEMLPNYEVVIPDEEYVEPSQQTGKTPGAKSQTTRPKVAEPGKYVIQAGSFSRFEDADRRKAGLALLGVESEIEKVSLDGGRTVYRVRTLALSNLDAVNRTLETLRAEGIDTLVMRSKD